MFLKRVQRHSSFNKINDTKFYYLYNSNIKDIIVEQWSAKNSFYKNIIPEKNILPKNSYIVENIEYF